MSNIKTAYTITYGKDSDLNIIGKIMLTPMIICFMTMALLWDFMDSAFLKKKH